MLALITCVMCMLEAHAALMLNSPNIYVDSRVPMSYFWTQIIKFDNISTQMIQSVYLMK